MRKLIYGDRGELEDLFRSPTSGVVLAAFYRDIGEAWISNTSHQLNGLILTGNTFYIGGEKIDLHTIQYIMELIRNRQLMGCTIIPQRNKMIPVLDAMFQDNQFHYQVKKSSRHLMKINMDELNQDMLINWVKRLPDTYQLKSIDEALFNLARSSGLNGFIELYPDYDTYLRDGFGFFIMEASKIIGGISAYARYKEGVEVQIEVQPEYRGQHLAHILGAVFLLECKKRKMYPWWDCANPVSERIANGLGYQLKQITTIYKVLCDQ